MKLLRPNDWPAGFAIEEESDNATACWIWQADTNWAGYGRVRVREEGRQRPAHRVIYERTFGPVPDGMELDHLCRNPACVNPLHLDPVTHRENMRRGEGAGWQINAVKTHCKHGHEYTPENTRILPSGARNCRICQRQNARNRWHARKAA